MLKRNYRFMDATNGAGDDTGGGAPAGGQPPGSALSQGVAPPAGQNDWLPEKYRVEKEGAIDIEASARKVAEAYKHLEHRLGSGDVPPKTPEEYELKGLPDTVKIEDIKADPKMQGFLKSAHGKGLTNDQVSFVLNEYLSRAPELIEGNKALTSEEVTASLKEIWKDEPAYKENMSHAFKAASALGGKIGLTFEEIEKAGLGDNPMFIRLMAALGPELGEDTLPNDAQPVGADWEGQVAALKANPAYNDPKHPEHKTIMAKVSALYEKKHGNKRQKLFSGVGN